MQRNFLPFPPQGLYVITRDPQGERVNLLEEVKSAVREVLLSSNIVRRRGGVQLMKRGIFWQSAEAPLSL